MGNRKLKEVLGHILSKNEIQIFIRGYDVLGDVAIIIVPEELVHHEETIAKAILDTGPNIRVVAKRVGNYSGEYRTISLKVIGGKGGLETIHREFGVRLHVDPEKVYFSSRSGNERYRIATQVMPGERVLVMFSGIAPLPLMIGQHCEASDITGIEKNPEAHLYGLKNLRANQRIKNIQLLHGDVRDIIPQLPGNYDRIAMPLPMSASSYLQLALKVLMGGGWLHFYDFQYVGEFECAEDSVRTACSYLGKEIVQTKTYKCGHVSPGKYRICVDALVSDL